MSELSTRLKELREEKEISTRELAKVLKISARAIQRWEKEERVPNLNTIIEIAKFFEVSLDYLVGLED